jgi:hypothetical protein
VKLRPRYFTLEPSEYMSFKAALEKANNGGSPLTEKKIIRRRPSHDVSLTYFA